MTGVKINRVEIWVTNKTGTTTNTRNIVALTDLGETNPAKINGIWQVTGVQVPSNGANTEYQQMVTTYSAARNIDQTSTVLDGISRFVGGADYEKLQSARLLSPSEYTVNTALGYISLNMEVHTDQVLAVAFEYTYGGQTYQVGEFASDITDVQQALFVKALKNTSNNPHQRNWGLMMKNVYYLASTVEKDKFRLDVKFQSDTAGVYLTYIPEPQIKNEMLIKVLGADRLDNNMKVHSNGRFDFVEGYTVSNGRVFFPAAEPFGQYLYKYLTSKGISDEKAKRYAFTELYDSTMTVAKQIAEKNKFVLTGQFRGTSANVISLGAQYVPQGSVVVTAGGVTLSEGSDYTVNYSAGEVTILNQSIIDAGTPINVSLESNTDWGQMRKTMFGVNWAYDFSKDFQLSGTLQHLSEQALTTKVNMGSEPLNNTLWGVNMNWKKESQWLTNLLDKIPLRSRRNSRSRVNLPNSSRVRVAERKTMPRISTISRIRNRPSTFPHRPRGCCRACRRNSLKVATKQASRAVSTVRKWHGTPSTRSSRAVRRVSRPATSRATSTNFPTTTFAKSIPTNSSPTATKVVTAVPQPRCRFSTSPIIPTSAVHTTSTPTLRPTVNSTIRHSTGAV